MQFWTPTRVEQVRELAGKGYSAGQIAIEFSKELRRTVARNAVIGCCYRNKIELRGGRGGGGKGPRAKAQRRAFLGKKAPAPAMPALPVEKPVPRPAPLKPLRLPPTKAIGAFRAIDALRPADCRWPIGDPKEPGFRFCGCQREHGASYCSHHKRLAYQEGSSTNGRAKDQTGREAR